jgi:hypothetical protein
VRSVGGEDWDGLDLGPLAGVQKGSSERGSSIQWCAERVEIVSGLSPTAGRERNQCSQLHRPRKGQRT